MPDRQGPQKEVIRTGEAMPAPKDINKTDIQLFFEQELRTNPFGHNLSGDHVYRRAERIAAAVHVLTAHISPSEPVRRLVREESIALLHFALKLKDELRASSSEIFKLAQASVRKLISLTRLLGVSGFASPQNMQMLVEALDELGTLLTTSQRSALSESTPLSREDLMPRRAEIEGVGTLQGSARRGKRAVSMIGGIKDKPVKDIDVLQGTIGTRALRILDILRSGGNLGIKDIASNLPEYSEKMIQRELASLAAAGKVSKFGAKRWSRYATT